MWKLFDLIASNTDYPGRLHVNFKINSIRNLAHIFSKLTEQRASKVIVEVHKKRTTCVDNESIPTLDKDNEQEERATTAGTNRQKSYTPRPICNDDWCKFNFAIVCHKEDDKWYLRYSYCQNKCNPSHNDHLSLCVGRFTINLCHLPPELDQFIIHHLKYFFVQLR